MLLVSSFAGIHFKNGNLCRMSFIVNCLQGKNAWFSPDSCICVPGKCYSVFIEVGWVNFNLSNPDFSFVLLCRYLFELIVSMVMLKMIVVING
jgi:hypothetical protein